MLWPDPSRETGSKLHPPPLQSTRLRLPKFSLSERINMLVEGGHEVDNGLSWTKAKSTIKKLTNNPKHQNPAINQGKIMPIYSATSYRL